MGKPWRVGLNTCFFFPFYIWTGFFSTFLFPKQFIQNKKKKRESGQNYTRWLLLLVGRNTAFLAATGITERDGRESFPFSKVYWTVAILCVCVLFFLNSTLDDSPSVSLSSLARAGFVFTFSLSFILIREKKKKKKEKDERHRPS